MKSPLRKWEKNIPNIVWNYTMKMMCLSKMKIMITLQMTLTWNTFCAEDERHKIINLSDVFKLESIGLALIRTSDRLPWRGWVRLKEAE